MDLISRQDALEIIDKMKEIYFDRKLILAIVYDQIKDMPSAESCENPSEIARKSNASGDLINKIVGILIEEGQSDYKKFKLGETIRYTPSEISEILNRHKNEVTSAERVGKWISDWNKKIKMIDGCPDGSCHCSYCGEWLVASDEYLVKGIYCPNCGARMVVKNE